MKSRQKETKVVESCIVYAGFGGERQRKDNKKGAYFAINHPEMTRPAVISLERKQKTARRLSNAKVIKAAARGYRPFLDIFEDSRVFF